jgi:hypothetical protein
MRSLGGSIRFPIAVPRKRFPFFHSANRLLDAQQDSSDLNTGGPLDEVD